MGGTGMKEDFFPGLASDLEERFAELDSDLTTALLGSDEEYAALWKRLGELEEQYPLESWLEGAGTVSLSADEHAALVEYTRVTFKAENMERLNLYLAGHRDCFGYLKRIGLL
jgi:hypothetical protein